MRLTRILAGAAALTLALAGGLATPAPAADDVNKAALQRLGACVSGGGAADMLLLIDRSASLKRTDKDGARVNAAKYVVRQLSGVAQAYRWKVSVAVAGFDTRYEKKLDWTPLNSGTLSGVENVLDGFRAENNGLDTDYWAALDSARRELNARSASGSTCSFIAWFSDGELSIEPRNGGIANNSDDRKPYMDGNQVGTPEQATAAMASAEKDLCRAGGVADQTRSQGIITLGVGLSTPDSKPDFTLLKGITTGTGMSCGSIVSPAPGAFFTADGIDQLYQAFDQIASPGQSATVQESEVCSSGTPCPAGTHHFVLDASIAGVHALATTGTAGQRVIVTSPSGGSVELEPGQTAAVSKDLPGAAFSASWMSDRSVSLDLTRKADQGWIGTWSMAFVAPGEASGTARSSLHIYGDLLPSVTGLDALKFNSGGAGPGLTLGLARADGTAVDPAAVASAVTVDASIVQGEVTVPLGTGLDKAALSTPLKTDLTTLKPGQASLRLVLNVTTAAATAGGTSVPGTKLEPQSRDYAITILPPAAYPVVQPEADFGFTDKPGVVTAKVKLTGPGCAWLGQPTKVLTAPDGIDAPVVASTAAGKDACVAGELPLSIDVKKLGNGLASGTLTVMTLPETKTGDPVAATVKFKLDMERPPNGGVLVGLLVVVTAAGIAIPIGLLYLVKYLTSSIPGDSVASATVRGRVDESSSFVAGGVPISVQDLKATVLAGGSRRNVTLASGQTLVARMGALPTEGGYVVVEQPGAAAGGRQTGASVKGKARLPLAVQGNWSVALNPLDPRGGDVEVTVFTAPGGAGLTELLDDVRSNVVEWVATLRAALPMESGSSAPGSAGSTPVADEWGGVPGTSTPSTTTPTSVGPDVGW